jgi:flagellar hook-associated protein 1 FlgK
LRGLSGGVATTGLVSSRDQYAETTVRTQVSLLSHAKETLAGSTTIESALDLNGAGSIASSLDKLFTAFSAWSLTPNSNAAKQNVHAAAQELGTSFERTAGTISDAALNAERKIQTALDEVNGIAERIRQYNSDRRTGTGYDAGVDASLHSDLEKLAELIDVRAVWQEDGTITLLAGGQAALVVGDKSFTLSARYFHTDPSPANPDAIPSAHIANDVGTDITLSINGGKLGALLNFRNTEVPTLLGDTQNSGALNRLAQEVADRVNSILAAGYPQPSEPYHLFVYGASAISIAHTIRVNPALAPALLDATDPLADPPVVNGKALQLAALAQPASPADMIDGLSYVAYFGKLSADAGRNVSAATQEVDARTQLTAQARNMRSQVSGVSFDEEAVELVQLQRAYQATAQMIRTVDELLEIVISIGR